MEHGLKDIVFMLKKLKTPRAVCYNFELARDKLLGVPAFVRLVYCQHQANTSLNVWQGK